MNLGGLLAVAPGHKPRSQGVDGLPQGMAFLVIQCLDGGGVDDFVQWEGSEAPDLTVLTTVKPSTTKGRFLPGC